MFGARNVRTKLGVMLLSAMMANTCLNAQAQPTVENLVEAIENNIFSEVQIIVRTRPQSIYEQTELGEHPLLVAAEEGNLEIVEFLVDSGGNVNTQDKFGKTPLLEAAAMGHVNVVRFLVEKGADITAKDQDDMSALDYARSNEQSELIEYLEKMQAKGYSR